MSGILIQNGKQAFTDANSRPLAGGRVTFYSVGTQTLKDTFQDSALTILNTNPIILDARGEAAIYGSGPYRQVLQDASLNLIWDQVVPDASGAATQFIADLGNTTDPTKGAGLIPSAERVVQNIAVLRTLPKTGGSTSVYVLGYYKAGDGGGGSYYLDAADVVSLDNSGSVIVGSDGGRWKLTQQSEYSVKQWGAKGDGVTDDSGAFQNAINFIASLTGATENSNGSLFAPGGSRYLFNSSVTISTPINLRVNGAILFSPTTGSAIVIGAVAPTSGRNTGYHLWFEQFRATNGLSALPTGVNDSGSCGLEVRNMQFSDLYVGEAIGFTKAGVYFNCTNTTYSGQHVQDNTIRLGQIAYNGYGILCLSASASLGAFQVNQVTVQNAFSNWINCQLDNATYNSNTNNNLFTFNSMDTTPSGGIGIYLYGSYNQINMGYLAASIIPTATAFYNTVVVQNNLSSGPVFSYAFTLNGNILRTGAAATSQLPAAVAVTDNTAVQNTFGVPIIVCCTVGITATSGGAETVSASVGTSSTAPPVVNQAAVNQSSAPVSTYFPFSLFVPPGYYWKFAKSGPGTATYSTAQIYQAS